MKPKTLILDRSNWRCGSQGNYPFRHGDGLTSMLNEEGFRCCLGQFAQQCGVPDEVMERIGGPKTLCNLKNKYTKTLDWMLCDFGPNAILINDVEHTSLEAKERLLSELCAKHDIELIIKGEYRESVNLHSNAQQTIATETNS